MQCLHLVVFVHIQSDVYGITVLKTTLDEELAAKYGKA